MELRAHILGRSPETAALIARLETGKPGDILTDEELTKIANGRDTMPGGEGYGYLTSAIRHLAACPAPVYWERIRGAYAIRRITDSEKVKSSDADRKSVSRRAKKAARRLAFTNRENLTQEEAAKANALHAQLGTIAAFAHGDTTKKLEARAVQSAPDMTRLLEAFK